LRNSRQYELVIEYVLKVIIKRLKLLIENFSLFLKYNILGNSLFLFPPPRNFLFPLENILIKYAQNFPDYIFALPNFYITYDFIY